MAKGKLIVLSNPTSAQTEEAYNRWYNEVHAAEVVALDGIRSITRFRFSQQVSPAGAEPAHRYLAIYELDDVAKAVQGLADNATKMDLTGPIDFQTVAAAAFEPIFAMDKSELAKRK